jgi:hypothetical protein
MMKMATFHGLFWGIALIILGIGLMARFIYNIHFPWFRILIAFVLIYAGLWLLLRPKFDLSGSNLIIFSQGRLYYDESRKDYTVLFGSGTLDFTKVNITRTRSVEVNGIFSESVIRVGKDVNFRLKADAAFGSFINPNGKTVSFGSQHYQPPWFDPDKPYLNIKANVVFGSMRLVIDQS